MSVTESEYLKFVRNHPLERRTPIVEVWSKSKGIVLGEIKWYGAWRQYCFFPKPHTIYNNGCMTDIQNKIEELMEEWRNG